MKSECSSVCRHHAEPLALGYLVASWSLLLVESQPMPQ